VKPETRTVTQLFSRRPLHRPALPALGLWE